MADEIEIENLPEGGINPAWNDVLSVIPEDLHSQITPHFQNWDKQAQSRIEQANSQLSEWEPYQAFKEHGVTPQELEQGLRLMYEINNNPENVYKALAEHHKFTSEEPSEEQPDDTSSDPRYAKLEQGLNTLAKFQLEQLEAKKQAEQDAALDKELSDLKKKFADRGDFDTDFVLTKMLNGKPGEKAVEEFYALRDSILNKKSFAPKVLGSSRGGTGYPSQAIDPRKLDGKATRSLVAQMLEQANREGD
jgi:hypothetical protein